MLNHSAQKHTTLMSFPPSEKCVVSHPKPPPVAVRVVIKVDQVCTSGHRHNPMSNGPTVSSSCWS